MNEQMSRTKLLQMIHREREALEKTLDRLNPQQMIEPGVEGDWSVKDLLAHIAAWEGMMVSWIAESLRDQVPDRPAPGTAWDDLDRLNAQLYAENKDRPLDEVLTDSRASFKRALETVETLTEQDLIDPDRFPWRKGDPMWHMVAANTCWHYEEHRQTIESWLK